MKLIHLKKQSNQVMIQVIILYFILIRIGIIYQLVYGHILKQAILIRLISGT